uniref:MBG domain-containing protein n=1 Tax=Cupriavidus metallidurans TaxID=119219 RepID=UPI000A73D6F8
GSLGRQSGEGVGNYAITNGSLASTNNYALTINTTGANETITAANLTVNASNATKTYGTNDPTLAYTTAGLVNGTVQSRDANGNLVNVTLADTAANTLTGSLGRQSGEGVGNYALTNGSLASTSNYALTINTTDAYESITPAVLTATASNATKIHGTADPVLDYTISGLANGTVQSRDENGNLVNVTLNDSAENMLTGSLGRQSGEGVGSYAIAAGNLALSLPKANYQLMVDTAGAMLTITPEKSRQSANSTVPPEQAPALACFADHARDTNGAANEKPVAGTLQGGFACMKQWDHPMDMKVVSTGIRQLQQ